MQHLDIWSPESIVVLCPLSRTATTRSFHFIWPTDGQEANRAAQLKPSLRSRNHHQLFGEGCFHFITMKMIMSSLTFVTLTTKVRSVSIVMTKMNTDYHCWAASLILSPTGWLKEVLRDRTRPRALLPCLCFNKVDCLSALFKTIST